MELGPNDKKIILIIIAAFLLLQTLIYIYSYTLFGLNIDFIKIISNVMPSASLKNIVRSFLMDIWIIPLFLTWFIND